MINISQEVLYYDIVLDEELEGFLEKLEYIAPPCDMVARIMQAVSTLPQPEPLSQWKDYEFYAVGYNQDRLC